MRVNITFVVPPGVGPGVATALLQGQTLEAHTFHIDRLGALHVFAKTEAGAPETIVVYAPGVWRSISDVGAFAAALPKEAPREDSRRR